MGETKNKKSKQEKELKKQDSQSNAQKETKKSASARKKWTGIDLKSIRNLRLDSKLNPKIVFFTFFVTLIICLAVLFFTQKILEQIKWEFEPLKKPPSYQTVLLSGAKGTIKSAEKRVFVLTTEGDKEIQFYINANTSLFNKSGQKISDEPGFLFSDYLKSGQKAKVLYAKYETVYLASKILLLE